MLDFCKVETPPDATRMVLFLVAESLANGKDGAKSEARTRCVEASSFLPVHGSVFRLAANSHIHGTSCHSREMERSGESGLAAEYLSGGRPWNEMAESCILRHA